MYNARMKITSPFPGMDPYLEAHWGDVHHSLIQYSRDFLQGTLPEDLLARVEERVYLEQDDVRVRTIAPDARISEWQSNGDGGGGTAVAEEVALAEPRVFVVEPDELTEGFIEIRERDGNRVVTILEFLSPANKAGGEGMRQYYQKQTEILRSPTSLVEIDLVRAGQRVLAIPAHMIPKEWGHDFLACIRRSWRGSHREIYSFPLRKRLPVLPIPLRSKEKPVGLDLQAILDQCYQLGRYDKLNYREDPTPPLLEADRVWAVELLQAAGRR